MTRGLCTSSAAGSGSAVCSICVQQNMARREGEKSACPVCQGTDTVPFATITKMLHLHRSSLNAHLSKHDVTLLACQVNQRGFRYGLRRTEELAPTPTSSFIRTMHLQRELECTTVPVHARPQATAHRDPARRQITAPATRKLTRTPSIHARFHARIHAEKDEDSQTVHPDVNAR